jgi:multicomponent Na+:H+ antiporter subunit F
VTAWTIAAGVLLVVAAGPGLLLAARGGALLRLAGLQVVTACVVLLFVVLSVASGQSSLLIVPLVLVLLSFAGTLVFTRLLRRAPLRSVSGPPRTRP